MRFNGELYKCVCTFLTIIEIELEKKPGDERNRYLNLTDYFKQLRKTAKRKVPEVNISSRTRFIMAFINIHSNNWKTRDANANGNQRN